MTPPPHPPKITFGDLRASGVRDVPIYCRDHRCSHHGEINADRWPDHIRCGQIARPKSRAFDSTRRERPG